METNSTHLTDRKNKQLVRRMEGLELRNPIVTPSVMISSTVEDLAQEREAVDRAICGLGLTRFRVEDCSFSQPPREICASLATQCDIFILLAGKRTGHLIEPEGISVVEFEYELARSDNPRKILIYVQDGVTREPRLEEFLNRLRNFERGYVTSLFTSPEDLSQKIQRDVTRWLASQVTQKPTEKNRL